jgi:uncharacterized FlgJ-related protein|tara:strand:- start:3247 stop:3534 length:288 start_codon:yes stop_codon:yes gene_type:complete
MNFYKKAIFIFLLFLFFMVVFVKMLEPVVNKQFSNIFAEKKLSTKLKEELVSSTEEFTPEKRLFYKNIIKKIYIKWIPLIEESISEANTEIESSQ